MASRFSSISLSQAHTIHEAAELGKIDKLQQFVDAGLEMGYPARETLRKRDTLVGATCLHYAAEHGHLECAKVLGQLSCAVCFSAVTHLAELHSGWSTTMSRSSQPTIRE